MIVANDKVRHLRYESLRKQLSEIAEWPHCYRHKIIGKNTEGFRGGLCELEELFPKLKKSNTGLSRKGSYLSVTFELQADDVDEIISLWVASESIQDLVSIL